MSVEQFGIFTLADVAHLLLLWELTRTHRAEATVVVAFSQGN
jgi:hypothetical protein